MRKLNNMTQFPWWLLQNYLCTRTNRLPNRFSESGKEYGKYREDIAYYTDLQSNNEALFGWEHLRHL